MEDQPFNPIFGAFFRDLLYSAVQPLSELPHLPESLLSEALLLFRARFRLPGLFPRPFESRFERRDGLFQGIQSPGHGAILTAEVFDLALQTEPRPFQCDEGIQLFHPVLSGCSSVDARGR